MFKKLCSVVLAISCAIMVHAGIKDLPVRNIDGTDYYCYTVEAGEGTLAITKKLGISLNDLEKYNPEIAKGLKLGQELRFPVKKFSSASGSKAVKPKSVVNYVAKDGDTVYGISKMFGMEIYDFLELNPEAIEGVKSGKTYKVISSSGSTQSSPKVSEPEKGSSSVFGTHTIQQGETLYSIANKYGVTVTDILRLNPGVDNNHYEAGQSINLPQAKSSANEVVSGAFRKGTRYIVKPHDTFYGVARQYGLSVAQLQEANPGVNVLREGETIILPDACNESSAERNATAGEPESNAVKPAVELSPADQPSTTNQINKPNDRLTIALLMPFQAALKDRSREAKSSAEFYRGFMIAADSVKSAGFPMTIIAVDIDQSGVDLQSSLLNPSLADADFIIAPESAETIGRIGEYGKERGINVFNFFSTKDDSYLNNPHMFQGNIPYDDMVSKAGDYLSSLAGRSTVVILRPKVNVDKIEVVEQFSRKLKAAGVEILEISYDDKLTAEHLAKLSPDGDYIFLPTTAKVNPSTDILAALAKFKEEKAGNARISVFGYPEWIVLKGKALENMKTVNTMIYSRFFIDQSENSENSIDEAHHFWYGTDMPAGVPRMTLSGFDAAMFLIQAWKENKGDFSTFSPNFNGEQNPYHFVRSGNNGGWVNDCMYIINYYPSGMVSKVTL